MSQYLAPAQTGVSDPPGVRRPSPMRNGNGQGRWLPRETLTAVRSRRMRLRARGRRQPLSPSAGDRRVRVGGGEPIPVFHRHTRACAHRHTQTDRQTDRHALARPSTRPAHTRAHPRTAPRTPTPTQTYSRTRTSTHSPTRTRAHAHAHTHTRARAHTRTRTHTHTRTQAHIGAPCRCVRAGARGSRPPTAA